MPVEKENLDRERARLPAGRRMTIVASASGNAVLAIPRLRMLSLQAVSVTARCFAEGKTDETS